MSEPESEPDYPRTLAELQKWMSWKNRTQPIKPPAVEDGQRERDAGNGRSREE
jgi:hypothetical protein